MQSRALTFISTLLLGAAAAGVACSDDGLGTPLGNGGSGGTSAGQGGSGNAGSAGQGGSANTGSAGSGNAGSGNAGSGGSAGNAGSGSAGSAGAGGDAGTGSGTCETFDAAGCVAECEGTGAAAHQLGCDAVYATMQSCFATENDWVCGDSPSHPQPAGCSVEQSAFIDCFIAQPGGADGGAGDFSSVCQSVCDEEAAFQAGAGAGDAGTADAGDAG